MIGRNLHWINGPQDQRETSNRAEEGGGLGILSLDHTTAIKPELIYDHEISDAGNGVPAPLWTFLNGEGCEETSQDHDNIGNHGNKDIGTSQTSQERKIQEQEWGCDAPVDITGPVNFTVDSLVGIREVLDLLREDDLVV